MSVVEAWTPSGAARIVGEGYESVATVEPRSVELEAALRVCALAAARCSSGRVVERDGEWQAVGDPMEAALHAFALRLAVDIDAASRDTPEYRRFPFDPLRRRMSVVTSTDVMVKGAPDAVLPLCRDGDRAAKVIESMAERGLRVLAVASRPVGDDAPATAAAAEHDLTILGVLALEDPPRPHAAASIAACRTAGMKVAMVTGDHPTTSVAIARETGLWLTDSIAVEGYELPTEESELAELVDRDGVVLARISPEQKLRIARALRSRGHVVAMTGDGVNDGPALRAADIGIAMGRGGSDVAREAADLVLLDDDFATIVAAIEQGRATFANVRRFLTYHLTDNVAELTPFVVWALSAGHVPLAIGVLQILALDIGTDTLPAVALGADGPDAHTLERPPARGRLLDATVARRAFGVLGPAEAGMAMMAFLATFVASGWRPGDTFPEGDTLAAASGAAFTAIVLGQMANAFACRSRMRPVWRIPVRNNPLLLVAVAVEVAILVALLWIPGFAHLLDHAPPSAAGWLVAIATPLVLLMADSLYKRGRRRVRARRSGSMALDRGQAERS
jgi:magnesium-transporting ATPase (P-type)